MVFVIGVGRNTTTMRENCPFCDSTSHKPSDCNSTMGGRRAYLEACMEEKVCPDFNSFTTKELKFIAFHTKYEKALPFPPLVTKCRWKCGGHNYNRKYGFSPIPMTLSKKRLAQSIASRWSSLRPVATRKQNVVECEDCPICYDPIFESNWNQCTSKWDEEWLLRHNKNGETFCPVRTTCNHLFCAPCWLQLPRHPDNTASCPMCRRTTLAGLVITPTVAHRGANEGDTRRRRKWLLNRMYSA